MLFYIKKKHMLFLKRKNPRIMNSIHISSCKSKFDIVLLCPGPVGLIKLFDQH